MAKVVLKGVEKQYPNGFKAVHGIDLEIKDGEFMVFVGPSGCAKSTTLRMIAGLEEITGGEIWIGDKLVNDLHPKDRGIAMVFQNYALYPHMTVYENMAFGLRMAKVPKDEIDRRVKEAAEKLEITQLLDRKPKEMSGGQRQRVAVGRAIVRKPDVFLFDEPLSNLDAKLRVSMRVKITQLHKQLKAEGQIATMIYVTHDQVEAMTMGDRICVLNYGRIMQVDTPLNLYHHPKNKFVAGFIGSPSMNFIEGAIEETDDGIVFIFGLGKERFFLLPEKMGEKVKGYIGKKVILGIRPENIGNKITHPDGEPINFIEGEINLVEHMGNEEFIHFTIDGAEFESRIEARKTENVKYGDKANFFFNVKRAHIFDIETEENISLNWDVE
ncbi:Oligosaccharides import ATP-binding protein MsmX [Fusobacterium sp. DD29]|uniref:ABC transporter ATP-binding protein n=1 Tax=unclassified Fusobacterium TaxID=2648384 RepID=UPI001B8BA66D|nr:MULTISPECIES: sn-glycerol-3-phosphate ABC transporter ATP-binding protein UgpC [unclassified Fusobacterium]MBR8701627.1 Oligosaccharides import ATP-binding protein MsmX [Fusobacterium sp. DD45]MBR8711408.1 Oligosaccharides import ATP-binding protein MsmX [Fusobacterium sp. DD28]MBR8749849.1 Oligosaccharides import ATP-binding protein MsmX [Fusobacterium sp. DD29]MBR8751963.1 Oligosaccharides import ATP-binding protein MsmX [Fusobacterium sp. DD26]MBR8762091.1 Oligosaccharides import ATP-bin